MLDNNVIKKVVNNNLCIGCGLCEGIDQNIKMTVDPNGFLVPDISNGFSDNTLNTITKVCPGINMTTGHKNEQGLWGKTKGCYTGYSNDENIRHAGSSGGAITGILKGLLDNKEVDAVIQVGPNFDKSPFLNEVYLNSTYEEILFCASSRYSPSSPLSNINKVLNSNSKFAFVGKPCDITALRNLAKIDKRINEKILYMLSFFCAGLPSEKGSDDILTKLKIKKEDVISFRYRGNGWPGKTSAILKNNVKSEITYNESWGGVLSKCVHTRCKVCVDSIGASADLVAADAWYSKGDGYPEFDEKPGRSLILGRTEIGENLLQRMNQYGLINLQELNIGDIRQMQPGQVKKRTELLGRLFAFKLNPFQLSPKFCLKNVAYLSKYISTKKTLIAFAGMTKRLMVKQIKSIIKTVN